jgi:D-alanyl-D-alanine carboxypeptidase (penicillin-binding protein 5/6)
MTALIALENGRLDSIVTVTPKAASIYTGSILGLTAGDKLTLENLIKAALITSANDSTVAIAEYLAGTEDCFIEMMNIKAILLGALNTRFANTNGYTDPNHYSTAFDLAQITRFALKNPKLAELVQTKEAIVYWNNKKCQKIIGNTNMLVRMKAYPGIDGVKTGTTAKAGNCLIASATRKECRLIAVVLNCQNRYLDAINLLDYGFYQVKPVTFYRKRETVTHLEVKEGTKPKVAVLTAHSLIVNLAKDDLPRLKKEIKLTPNLLAPVKANQKVGEIILSLPEQELARVDLVVEQEILRKNWWQQIKEKIKF